MQNLTFLKRLNLDDNQITRIPALPPSLEELKINKNKLSTLTPHCFKGAACVSAEEIDTTKHNLVQKWCYFSLPF